MENALTSTGFLLQNGWGWRYFAKVGVGTLLGGQAALARSRQIRELQPFPLRSKVLPQPYQTTVYTKVESQPPLYTYTNHFRAFCSGIRSNRCCFRSPKQVARTRSQPCRCRVRNIRGPIENAAHAGCFAKAQIKKTTYGYSTMHDGAQAALSDSSSRTTTRRTSARVTPSPPPEYRGSSRPSSPSGRAARGGDGAARPRARGPLPPPPTPGRP